MAANLNPGRLPIIFALCLGGACQSFAPPPQWVKTEIYFGLTRSDGAVVTPEQWQAFVNEEITPRFPAGLSIVDATGQWREASGRIDQEQSKVLVLIYPAGLASDAAIDALRARYRERFKQESVMKVTVPARVAF